MYKKVTVSLIFGFLLVCAPMVASAQTLPNGTLVRASGDAKVYLLSHGQKYWFRTVEILNSYHFSWKNITEVSPNAIALYPDAQVVSLPGDSKIYYVKGWMKRWITSPTVFDANGFSWNMIVPVDALDLDHYEEGPALTEKASDAQGTTATLEIQAIPVQSDVPPGVDFSPLWNVWKTVEAKARNASTLDTQKMVQGAAEGVVKSLGDPYSVLMEPTDSKKFNEDIAGEFGGIGAELGYKNGIVIIATLPGMPAEKAGMQGGDTILKIDDESTGDMNVEEAVTRIRGTIGAPVKLLVAREGESAPIEFSITRALITVPTITWQKETNDIAYLRIYNFFGNVEGDFAQAIKEIKAGGMRKIVLDLRGNPGGLLNAGIDIAAEFIPKGRVIVSADFGAGKQRGEYTSPGGGTLENTPVIALVDGGSASAAEILAGALKDSDSATLIGETTFGKGTVQEVIQLSGGTILKLTTAEWIRPSGVSINKLGITPDITVPMTPEDRQAGRDPQLDKALSIMQGM